MYDGNISLFSKHDLSFVGCGRDLRDRARAAERCALDSCLITRVRFR